MTFAVNGTRDLSHRSTRSWLNTFSERGPLMATQAGGIRVLLVDDQRMFREGIRSLFGTVQNINVVGEADNGAEAIACVGKLNPQVVVMDINMPKMDGLAATKLVRRHYPNVAVLGLSVTEDSYHKSAMEKAGAFRVMTKGKHDLDELCREIEKAAATMQFLSHSRR